MTLSSISQNVRIRTDCNRLWATSSSKTTEHGNPSGSSSSSHSDDSLKGPIYDIAAPEEFESLFTNAASTTQPRTAITTSMGHDPFRFEWGTWVDNDALLALMDRTNEIRCQKGAYGLLISNYESKAEDSMNHALRLRIAGGQDWDCILHVLPQGSYWRGRWPTGSWSIVKPLIGVTEVAMLRESNMRKATSKDLRGGSDGTLGGGGATTGGEDCVKYVGGPIRSYTGKSGKTILLEVVIRPPVSKDSTLELDMDALQDISSILSVVPIEQEKDSVPQQRDTKMSQDEGSTSSQSIPQTNENSKQQQQQTHFARKGMDAPMEKDTNNKDNESTETQTKQLNAALGMSFDKVGGLDAQLDAIARRVLASRANPAAARRLGVSHVRGILLSGPPGCGKTLLARELARLLDAREPQIVNGPEILDKFIGEAEKKVRALFAPAAQEYAEVGDDSALHIIVLDEMDAIAKKRGTASSDTTGVRDSVVNQLLSCMDVRAGETDAILFCFFYFQVAHVVALSIFSTGHQRSKQCTRGRFDKSTGTHRPSYAPTRTFRSPVTS